MSAPSNKDRLREETGKAFSCYEKALFFSGNSPQVHFTVYQEDISDADRVAKITNIYAEAGDLVIARLEEVTSRYFDLQDALLKSNIKVADRNKESVKMSREIVVANFENLLVKIIKETKTGAYPESETLIAHYSLIWLGLNNLCRLFMDEITYLSGRVDTLNDYLNTANSLKYAVRGILASAGLSFCGIIVSILLNDAGKETAPKHVNTAFYLELGKERERLSEMADGNRQGFGSNLSEMNEKLDAINRDLETAAGDEGNRSRRVSNSVSP